MLVIIAYMSQLSLKMIWWRIARRKYTYIIFMICVYFKSFHSHCKKVTYIQWLNHKIHVFFNYYLASIVVFEYAWKKLPLIAKLVLYWILAAFKRHFGENCGTTLLLKLRRLCKKKLLNFCFSFWIENFLQSFNLRWMKFYHLFR